LHSEHPLHTFSVLARFCDGLKDACADDKLARDRSFQNYPCGDF